MHSLKGHPLHKIIIIYTNDMIKTGPSLHGFHIHVVYQICPKQSMYITKKKCNICIKTILLDAIY